MHESHARKFAVILEFDPDDDVWVTYVPSLGHLSTYGKTRDEALQQTREAIAGYLEVAAKEAEDVHARNTHDRNDPIPRRS